jgi:3-hydroxy-3-methylglutaryl CoA synthase
MNAGIVGYGAYIPIYRLSRAEIVKVWGSGSPKGEKAVANCDEDSVTMAVGAGMDALKGVDTSTVDVLYFASTTAPYREKKSASIIATALDLRSDIVTGDFGNSIGSGANALRAALDAVNAGSARKALVVAADCRLPAPKSAFEMALGDGAAALLIGIEDVAATVVGGHSMSSDFIDIWRKERNDTYLRSWEDRYIVEKGYTAHLKEAIKELLRKTQVKPAEIAKAALYGPDSRSHAGLARMIGLQPEQIQDGMFDSVGNTGAPFFLMLLVAALEKAKAGDQIMTGSYGDGADAWLFRVTDKIEGLKGRRGIEKHLASKMTLANYGTYMRFRDMMEWEATPLPPAESSANVFYREGKALTRGYGQTCNVCGHLQFPPQRICMWCQSKDQFVDTKIVDKVGKVFTYSLDDRAVFALDLPNIIVIADLEGGGRIYGQLTDRDPKAVSVGMEVEMTFRKYHEGSGFHNYSWKCRPVRC